MPIYDRQGGPVFLCGRGLDRPEKPVPCAFCGRKSSRLCDGKTEPGKTCDAPLCLRCTKQSAPLLVLPGIEDLDMAALQVERRMHTKSNANDKGARPVRYEEDPRDLCPKCVAEGRTP